MPCFTEEEKSVTAVFSASCPLDPLLKTRGLRVADLLLLYHS